MQITIYTDGACDIHAENKPGGWAAILHATDDNGNLIKETVIGGGAEDTTNNLMELTAVIEGLKVLTRPSSVTVVADSRYVIDIAGGIKKVIKNKALWQAYFAVAEPHQIKWKYIEGHSGDPLNERCDRLAVAEKRKLALPVSERAAEPELTGNTAIQVYLSTQYSKKVKATSWAAIVVQEEAVKEYSGRLADTTELEGTLIGAIKSLEYLVPDLDATVFTAQEYLSKGMQQWLPGWQARNWKTRNGEPVKYQQHWQALQRLASERTVRFQFVKSRGDNPYFQRGKALAAEVSQRA